MLASGCAALVVGGAGSTATGAQSRQAADARISAKIESEFSADRLLAGSNLSVSTTAGRVLLQGSVRSYELRAQAELLAAGVAGVVAVDNRIKIENRL